MSTVVVTAEPARASFRRRFDTGEDRTMQSLDSGVAGGGREAMPAAKRALPREWDQAYLRQCAWEITARMVHQTYVSPVNWVGISTITPIDGLATWNIDAGWIEQVSRRRADAWQACQMVLRLYDVSFIIFNGLNAHHIADIPLSRISGHCRFKLLHPGTCQIAEVGFRLRSGEFIPAGRSEVLAFAPDVVSTRQNRDALFVDDSLRPEPVASPWETETFLWERSRPRLRRGLRVAMLSLESIAGGHQTVSSRFASELSARLQASGHELHLIVPATSHLPADHCINGVQHHVVEVERSGDPIQDALRFARASQQRIDQLPQFDLFHLHEWMAGLVPWAGTRPTVLSLTSVERTRRAGLEPDGLSREISRTERELAATVDCILAPFPVREALLADYGIDGARVHAFPLDGRTIRDWDAPIVPARIKRDIQLSPHDRVLLFIGPVEAAAGADLLIEALPEVLHRSADVRLVVVGVGGQADQLAARSRALGVSSAVRWIGHLESRRLIRLLRVAEGLVMPSRQRFPYDESLIGLARRAGKPVVLSHAGPAQLVKHDETGLLAYPHVGSVVWALSRLLESPDRSRRMGAAGWQPAGGEVDWTAVAEYYGELCASAYGELAEENSSRTGNPVRRLT